MNTIMSCRSWPGGGRPGVLGSLLALVALGLSLSGCPAPPPDAESTAGAPGADPATAPTADSATPTSDRGDSGGSDTQRNAWGDERGIPLGSYMSLTGDIADYGTSSNLGMGLAVEEINAAGGVNGQPLYLRVEDAASKQEEAVNAARRLLDVHHVVTLIGEVASSLSLAVAPIAQKAGVPMLSPSSTFPPLTDKGDYIFRSCFTDAQQGAYIGKFALDQGYRRGALLTDVGQDYSKGLAENIEQTFEAKGGEIVARQNYTSQDKDFSAPLTDLKSQNVDVIFVPGYYQEAALIIKQARELGIEAAIVGGDGWDGSVLQELAGDYLDDDCYFVNHYHKSADDPRVKQFVEAFRERFGRDPNAMAATAYDAIHIVADAIERAGSSDPAAIRDALAATKDFAGVTGTITIDDQRNAVKPCVVLGFENGEQTVVDRISPEEI